ncbi:MAG: sodium:solute symporter family protein [Clostridiales Family XIII bacterium]|jgi:SSS family solute:Na+ symporter|nr:sodium:solute symporter family protein [Clostridiales Family XIII bacterium]
MNSIQITALTIILVYMAATVCLGLFISQRKKNKAQKQSNEDFLMAGKSLGPLVLAGTLFAANTGGASTMGVATNVLGQGLSASWYVIAAGIGFVLVSFIAPYFRRSQSSTVPEIISKRFGKGAHVFTAFTSISALFMATGAQIIATASIINVVTGFSFNIAAVITTIIVIIYTMIGGFKSVTAANMMHVLFITVGMTAAMFIMVNNSEVGGFSALMDRAAAFTTLPDGAPVNLLGVLEVGVPTIIGYIAMYFMTFPTGQEIVQTFCSAKSGGAAKAGSLIAGLLSAAYAIVPALIGLMAYVCIDGYASEGMQKNALAEATIHFAPPVIAGIVLAAIVAATMSSASGNMIGTATMFTNDVFRPYINKGVHDDRKEVWISRLTMVVVGAVGLLIAIFSKNIISVMMGAFALRSAGPFAAFICSLFYRGVTRRAGFLSIVIGTIVAAVWIYGFKTPWGLSAMVPGGIAAFLTIFSVSVLDRKLGLPAAPEIEFSDN